MNNIQSLIPDSDIQQTRSFIANHQHQLQWERQWLEQQNEAFSIVEGQDVAAYDRADAAISIGLPATQIQAIYKAEVAVSTKQQSMLNAGDSDLFLEKPNVVVASRIDVKPGTVSTGLVAYSESLKTSRAFQSAEPSPQFVLPREELRQFGVWRSDNTISVAMGVAPDSTPILSIIKTLRQWLAHSGLQLISLKVNGRERSSVGHEPQTDSSRKNLKY